MIINKTDIIEHLKGVKQKILHRLQVATNLIRDFLHRL